MLKKSLLVTLALVTLMGLFGPVALAATTQNAPVGVANEVSTTVHQPAVIEILPNTGIDSRWFAAAFLLMAIGFALLVFYPRPQANKIRR